MSARDCIPESDLSKALKDLLKKAGFEKFSRLAKLRILELKRQVPRLKVRHLANIKHELLMRGMDLVPGEAIEIDRFINQAKLHLLWQKGVITYKELEGLPEADFIQVIGGHNSLFFRNKKGAAYWMNRHGIKGIEKYNTEVLTEATFKALFKKDIFFLKDLSKVSDYELALMLQPSFKLGKKPTPLTRARIMEINYAFWKNGLTRTYKPL